LNHMFVWIDNSIEYQKENKEWYAG